MDMSREEYRSYVEGMATPSPTGKNLCWAFVTEGLICVLGQLLGDGFRALGVEEDMVGTAVSVTLIFLTALLTGLGVFDRLAKRAGAGTLVPITGFANAVAAPAMEFHSEGLITGTAGKLFTVAGPVLTCGLAAGVVYGLLLWLSGLL